MTRILVVEDEESFSEALSYLLGKEGFDVAVAGSGPDAIVEFDKNGKKLRENKSRKGKDHSWLIPLTTEAIKILESLPTFADKKGIVFTSAWGNSVRNNHPIIKKLGYGDLATAHGFRSSFSDWASETGVSRDLAERALAHTIQNSIEAAYHRTDLLEQRRAVMEAWAAHVTGLA